MSDQEKQVFLSCGDLLSLAEAAVLTPYSAEYLGLRARAGKLKAVKIGNNWVTTRAAILDYLRQQKRDHLDSLKNLQFYERMLS